MLNGNQVFIVLIEIEREGVQCWDIARVFISMDAANIYIQEKKNSFYLSSFPQECPEFTIEVEEVYA